MDTLGKSDVIKRIAEKTGTSQKECESHLNAFLEIVRDAMHSGEEVRLIGFGSFAVQDVAAREGVNPRTREKIQIPAGKRVKFSPGKELQSATETKHAAPAAKSAPAAKAPAAPAKGKH
jgi:DNA-binding protein HU-beta